MESRQAKFVFGLMVLVIFFWLVSPMVGGIQEPAWVLPQFSLSFDASRAYETTREFVTRFPRRVLGSIEARQSTGFLRQQLEPLGYKISYMHFDATIAGHRQVGRNVLAFKAGQVPEILAVIAHYDTAGTTYQGAMDDGSGIGALLELARILSSSPTRRSLLFVASDGEEWGMLGARDLARNYPDRSKIVAALSLDGVAVGSLSEITLDTVGQMGGYTPPWLRQISSIAAGAQALAVSEPSGFQEHLERALLLSWTDQGPLLAVGVPAINLGSESSDRVRQFTIYHSPQDTIDNLEVSSVDKYGKAAEEIVRTLDELPVIPKEAMGSFRLRDLMFLSPGTMLILHFLTFLPLVAVFCFHSINHGKYLNKERVLRELLALGGAVLPFLAVYYTIVLLRLLRVMPGYSLYPATPKDPVLEHPSWAVLGGLIAVALVIAVICFFVVKFLCRDMSRPDFYVSKLILLAILIVVAIVGLFYNAYWAVSFLALPVWVWMLVGLGQGVGGRAANRIYIVAAGVPCFLVETHYAARLGLGWKLAWYEILALSTGIFTLTAFLLAAAAVSLGLRFLVIQSQRRPD